MPTCEVVGIQYRKRLSGLQRDTRNKSCAEMQPGSRAAFVVAEISFGAKIW